MIIKSCIKWTNFNIFAFFQFTVISSYNKLSFDIKTNSQTKSKPHYFVYLKRDIVCSISCANTFCASRHFTVAVELQYTWPKVGKFFNKKLRFFNHIKKHSFGKRINTVSYGNGFATFSYFFYVIILWH